MAQRPPFTNGEFYHIYNRGVEKRKIFLDKKDYFRFLHDLFEFNDADETLNLNYYYYGSPTTIVERRPRKLLVDVLAFALMPNHYHLLLRQRRENGISKFLQKLAGGYTRYFNEKRERSGVLFQGKFKAKHINDDRYLRHLLLYLHTNPVDIFQKNWKRAGITHAARALRFLERYRWSSYPDYLGIKNFPSVINLELVDEFGLPKGKEQQKIMVEWLGAPGQKMQNVYDFTFDH